MAELHMSTPSYYVNRPGALKNLSDVLTELMGSGRHKALLIASSSSWREAGSVIGEQLSETGWDSDRAEFSGFPSERQVRYYASLAQEQNADLLIGIGGGRVLDATKAAGTLSGRRVVTVPTIAATCACWARVSILYTDEGDFDRIFRNTHSPAAIVADTDMIAKAPVRYLKAGMADTLAKWYEPYYTAAIDNVIARHGAELAKDLILRKAPAVIREAGKGSASEDMIDIVDAILYLAGFVGSFVGEKAFGGMAHPFYDASRHIPAVRKKLHGEVVAYGLILQGIYEDRSGPDLEERFRILDSLDNLYTSEELGFADDGERSEVADRIVTLYPYTREHGVVPDKVVEAIHRTDLAVLRYRREGSI